MFLKKTSSVFIAQGVTFVLQFATSVALARLLGPVGKGQIALLATTTGLISLISNLGITSASVYYMNRNQTERSAVTSTAFILQMGLTIAALIAALLLAPWLIKYILREEVSILLLGISLIFMPFSMLTNILNNFLLGIGEIGKYNYSNIILKSTQLGLMLMLVQFGVPGVLIATGLATICAAAFGWYCLWKYHLTPTLAVSRKWNKPLLAYGLKAWIGNILQYFNYRLDTFLVNYFIGAAQVGQYSIAVTMAETIWYIPNAVSTVLFPKTASDWDKATNFTPIVARNVVFVTTLAAALLAIISYPVINLFYGTAFLPSVMPLLGLLPGIVFLGVGKVIASDLAGRGKPQYGTISASISLILTVVFDILLIPWIGITGAGIASSLSYILNSLFLLYFYTKLSGNTVRSVLILQADDLPRYVALWKRMRGKVVQSL